VTRAAKPKADPPALRGWAAIALFLGMPQSTVQRWAKEGMPVERAGRNVTANPDELNRWLQRTTGEPAGSHVVTSETDLMKISALLLPRGKDPPTLRDLASDTYRNRFDYSYLVSA
jgi:hypothetical protein